MKQQGYTCIFVFMFTPWCFGTPHLCTANMGHKECVWGLTEPGQMLSLGLCSVEPGKSRTCCSLTDLVSKALQNFYKPSLFSWYSRWRWGREFSASLTFKLCIILRARNKTSKSQFPFIPLDFAVLQHHIKGKWTNFYFFFPTVVLPKNNKDDFSIN